MNKYLFCVLFFLFALHAFAAEEVVVLSTRLLQGDTLVVVIPQEKAAVIDSVLFDGRALAVFPYGGSYRAIAGIPATKRPGSYTLRIRYRNGSVFEKTVRVIARRFVRVDLGIPKSLGLSPKGLVEKLQTEKVNIASVLAAGGTEALFRVPFGLPLYDNRRIGSPFGEIRKTGDTEIRHLGVDFSARRGAPVAAINAGVVKRAYTDTVYGNTVIVDHGRGVFSLYMHLYEMKTREGERVKKGSVIGTVGTSGYATAPHLHLSLKVDGVSVDPIRFVSLFR